MALIKCPECGHEISEFAPACIFCGCPMDKIKELSGKSCNFEEKEEKNNNVSHDKFVKLVQDYFAKRKISAKPRVLDLVTDIFKFFSSESKCRFFWIEGKKRYKYYFESREFSLGYLSTKDVEFIYAYYKVSKLMELIQQYEHIFNKKIISDHQTFKNEVANMALGRGIVLSNCKSLLSTISFIPDSTIDNLISGFAEIENLTL